MALAMKMSAIQENENVCVGYIVHGFWGSD